ncbi:MAG: FMN-binding protein [Phycisphaerae bacterium]|nr:FMN-binding protein [Phycisphaerae bacterium]
MRTQYDTAHPWKDARLEVRRLLGLNTEAARREAIKLTWVYLQKGDIGDGHEYPMYVFLGGEPLWAVRAHEEFLAKPHKEPPLHASISLASLYTRFGAFEKAKAALDRAMARLPAPPWRIAGQASLEDAFGDLYVAWGKTDSAREHYAKAIKLYPTSDQPYGQHLLKRQADRVQSKLDLLSVRSLSGARLRDGSYTSTALGYAGDVQITLSVREGRMTDIKVKHEEKIEQGACTVIPRRIIEKQSLQVDGVSGATVTTSAILDGTLQCLRKAGLP